MRLQHLIALYVSYQRNPSYNTGTTLIWVNLLRGLLNNFSWVLAWTYLMNLALTDASQNLNLQTAMISLRDQHLFLLLPPRTLNHPRQIRTTPNPAHIAIEHQETTIEFRGDQILATTLTPHPLLAQMDLYVMCSLILETGNVDYTEIFTHISYFEPPPYLSQDPLFFFKPMNIISWNVRRAAGADFRRILEKLLIATSLIWSYSPRLD